MPELVAPTVTLHAEFVASHAEWGPGLHEDGFGLAATDDVQTPAGFGVWIDRITQPGVTCRWIVENGQVLGAIALRHRPTQFGHIGYGIRPSARGRGLATWALGEILVSARDLGLDRVIAVVAAQNAASARVLQKAGGVLQDSREERRAHRYVIELRERRDGASVAGES